MLLLARAALSVLLFGVFKSSWAAPPPSPFPSPKVIVAKNLNSLSVVLTESEVFDTESLFSNVVDSVSNVSFTRTGVIEPNIIQALTAIVAQNIPPPPGPNVIGKLVDVFRPIIWQDFQVIPLSSLPQLLSQTWNLPDTVQQQFGILKFSDYTTFDTFVVDLGPLQFRQASAATYTEFIGAGRRVPSDTSDIMVEVGFVRAQGSGSPVQQYDNVDRTSCHSKWIFDKECHHYIEAVPRGFTAVELQTVISTLRHSALAEASRRLNGGARLFPFIFDPFLGDRNVIPGDCWMEWAIMDSWIAQKPVFDVSFYMAAHSDLRAAFGTNTALYARHWLENGIYEKRRASQEYDVKFYLETNPDVAGIYLGNPLLATVHYVSYGVREGRVASVPKELGSDPEVFEVNAYKDRNPDLVQVYGNQDSMYAIHFTTFGIYELRQASSAFSVEYYLKSNIDVRFECNEDPVLAAMHWLRRGRYEGRKGVPENHNTRFALQTN